MSCLRPGAHPSFLHVFPVKLRPGGPWGLLIGSVVNPGQPSQTFCIEHHVGALAGPTVG